MEFTIRVGAGTFPFLFGRAFIEANPPPEDVLQDAGFPFLFGRAFIEAGAGMDSGEYSP